MPATITMTHTLAWLILGFIGIKIISHDIQSQTSKNPDGSDHKES